MLKDFRGELFIRQTEGVDTPFQRPQFGKKVFLRCLGLKGC